MAWVGICSFVLLVLVVLVASCYFMWRPAPHTGNPSRCPPKNQSYLQKTVVPNAVKLSGQRPLTYGPDAGLESTDINPLTDLQPEDRKKRFQAGKRNYWQHNVLRENDRSIENNHLKRGDNGHLGDALGCNGGLKVINQQKKEKLHRLYQENSGNVLISANPYADYGETVQM